MTTTPDQHRDDPTEELPARGAGPDTTDTPADAESADTPGSTADGAADSAGSAATGESATSSASDSAADDARDGEGSAPPPVWTAANTAPARPQEPPARGTRVGQLIWAGIVLVAGLFMIALGLLTEVDVTLTLIGLVAALGLGLIIAAVATGRSRRP